MKLPRESKISSPRKTTNKPFFKLKKITLLLCLILTLSFLAQIEDAYSATIYVPGNYPTIQDAVENAAAGDTIHISPGIYYEHVVIYKSLTIQGEDPQTTIIDGTANGTVFYIDDASNVRITGLTIRNAGNNYSAIVSERTFATTDYIEIINNKITTSEYGIYLGKSNYCTISNNTFFNNPFGGVYLNRSNSTSISGNTITESAYGLRIMTSINNIIDGNTISQTSYAIHLTLSSTGNTILNNSLAGKTIAVYSTSDTPTVHHNTITDSAYGIYLYNCRNGQVYYNTFTSTSYGIRLYHASVTASYHNVRNNKIIGSDWALDLSNSNYNTITGNWLQENTYGIYMYQSSYNTVYRNNFLQNNMQVSAGTGTNTWDKDGNGNYWSDYTGTDSNGDGIGDTPYQISIGRDNYPLMTTWSEHDVSIENITTNTTQVSVGQTVNITVTVKNKGKLGTAETFTLTAKRNGTTISSTLVPTLAVGATRNISFIWNTTGQASGNYIISATASTVTDELNTDNNTYTDGAVRVDAPIPGDLDGNGAVNQQDLEMLKQEYGTTPSDPYWNPNVDLNGDGIVDAHDLRILGQNYGRTS